jgi:hypothetical protein
MTAFDIAEIAAMATFAQKALQSRTPVTEALESSSFAASCARVTRHEAVDDQDPHEQVVRSL